MPVEGIVGIVVAVLIIAGVAGFSLRGDSDSDTRDTITGGQTGGTSSGDDEKRPQILE